MLPLSFSIPPLPHPKLFVMLIFLTSKYFWNLPPQYVLLIIWLHPHHHCLGLVYLFLSRSVPGLYYELHKLELVNEQMNLDYSSLIGREKISLELSSIWLLKLSTWNENLTLILSSLRKRLFRWLPDQTPAASQTQLPRCLTHQYLPSYL